MHFADSTLVRLSDPKSRTELFTPVAAERLIVAAYGTSDALAEPFSATVDRLTLGVTASSEPQLRARVRPPDNRTWDVEATVTGLDAGALFLPAVVEGFLSATAEPVTGRVAAVETRAGTVPDLATLEAAASAAERADPTLFERRRRIELARRIANAALSDADADVLAQQWLSGADVTRVAELLAVGDGPHGMDRLALVFEPLEPGPPAVRSTRFVAGIVIDPLSSAEGALLGMLRHTRELQKLVMTAGRRTAALAGLEPTYPVPVLWLVPEASFQDEEWPVDAGVASADRPAEREGRAAGWLASHGIALVGVA